MKHMTSLALLSALALAAPAPVLAQSSGTEVARDGTCPTGFKASGSTCKSHSGAVALLKVGSSCPSGFKSSNKYCVGDKGDYAEIRSGSCPSGLKTSGQYCVK